MLLRGLFFLTKLDFVIPSEVYLTLFQYYAPICNYLTTKHVYRTMTEKQALAIYI